MPSGPRRAANRGAAGARGLSSPVCAKRPGSPRSLCPQPWAGRALVALPSFLPLLPASGTSGLLCGVGTQHRRASGEQALAAHAARAALVRRARLGHLVLPDLAHQRVEGVLHALGRRSRSEGDSGPQPEGPAGEETWRPRDPCHQLQQNPSPLFTCTHKQGAVHCSSRCPEPPIRHLLLSSSHRRRVAPGLALSLTTLCPPLSYCPCPQQPSC